MHKLVILFFLFAIFSLSAEGYNQISETKGSPSVIFEDIGIDEKLLPQLEENCLYLTGVSDVRSITIIAPNGKVVPLNIDTEQLQKGVDIGCLARGVYYLSLQGAEMRYFLKFMVR